MTPRKRSLDLLRDKSLYKSIAFTRAERKRLGLEGLLPHAVATQAQLVSRVMESLRRLPRDIDKIHGVVVAAGTQRSACSTAR